MKRFSGFAALLCLTVMLSWSPAILRADITGVVVTGPGGTPPASTLFGGHLAEPSLNYTSVAPFDVAITVDSATVNSPTDAYYISETPSFGGVLNSTGVAWSGFTWSLVSGPSAAFIYEPLSPGFSGLDFTGTFPSVGGTSTFATFSGGTLANGGSFEPAFRFNASQAGTYVIEETPIAAPEPSSIVLAGAGLCSLVTLTWRRRKRS
jgi:hypothetical protein